MNADNTSSNPDFMRKETDSGSPRILQAAIVLSILFMSPEVKEIFAQSRRSVKFKEKSSGSMDRNVAPVQYSTVPCSNALNVCAAKIWWAHLDSNQHKKKNGGEGNTER